MNDSTPRAGKYNRRITIQKPTGNTADDGQKTDTWSLHAVLWAAEDAQAGSEDHEQRRQQPEQRWRFLVRSSSTARAVTTQMRIVLADGAVLNIASARDLRSRKREVELIGELSKR